jgi:type IV fimbrial biogenesis protein FimT
MNTTTSPRHPRAAQRGVTLLELMVALSVLGVLLAIGVPAYTNITRENQIAAQSSTLMQAIILARSEALKRGLRVSVCPIANGDSSACLTANDWAGGWMIFEDDFGGAGTVDAGDRTLQVFPPAPGIQITTTTASAAVVFLPTAAAQARAEFDVTKSGCTGQQQRSVVVEATGRASTNRKAC